MLRNGSKYSNELRHLQSFAKEVTEKEKYRKRLKAMEEQMVDDIIEEDKKFKANLDEIIKKYDIKIDLASFKEERAKHSKKDFTKIKIEKRNKIIAKIEREMAEPVHDQANEKQKPSSQNSGANLIVADKVDK